MIRWLFSTVSISMVWDDHDMSDDWNISRSWHEEMDRKDWWHERAVDGIISYWIYQHLGNLSPRELDENELYAKVRGNPRRDRGPARAGRRRSTSTAAGTRWSFCRDIDGVRAIFMDSRAARVLTEERRSMFDDERLGLDRRPRQRRLRPPAARHHRPLPALPRLPPPRGLERAPLRRRLGRLGRRTAARSCAAPSTSTTGRPSSSPSSACASCSKRSAPASRGKAAGLDRAPLRRRPPRLPLRRRLQARAPRCRAPCYQAVCSPYRNPLDERTSAGSSAPASPAAFSTVAARPRPPAGRARPGHPLALARGPVLRQPGRRRCASTAARRSRGSTRPSPARRTRTSLEKTFERRLA